jgi:hypothetical protein
VIQPENNVEKPEPVEFWRKKTLRFNEEKESFEFSGRWPVKCIRIYILPKALQ